MIRRATPTDAAAITAIWNKAIRDTTITFNPIEKSEAEVAALLIKETPCYVFERDGAVLGFARYFPFRSGEGYRFSVEHSIILDESAQGNGAGRALLAAVCTTPKTLAST